MTKSFLIALPILTLGLSSVVEAQGFDGIWVGREVITRPFRPKPQVIENRRIEIIIAQNGHLLAITDGHCPGRFMDVHNISKQTLACHAGDCSLQVTLSPDGKTLTETGTSKGVARSHGTRPYGQVNVSTADVVPIEITGTLHRDRLP